MQTMSLFEHTNKKKMACSHVTYYSQTFPDSKSGVQPFADLLTQNCGCTHLIVGAIHFGYDPNGSPYIHLNDEHPDSPTFAKVWKSVEELSRGERKIVATLMVGGAGSAFTDLFKDFHTFYPLLVKTLKDRPYLRGVDLDVEERVDIDDLCSLINLLDHDFDSTFLITMAPLGPSLSNPEDPGMGGFAYGDLMKRLEGSRINFFHAQCYGGTFTLGMMDAIVQAGWTPKQVVCGIESGDYPDEESWSSLLTVIQDIKYKYPTWGGVFVWEYFDSPPSHGPRPGDWAAQISKILNPRPFSSCNIL